MTLLFSLCLCLIAYRDFKTLQIPNSYNLLLAAVALTLDGSLTPTRIKETVFMGIFILLLAVFTDAFGGGDVKMITAYTLGAGFGTAYAVIAISVTIIYLAHLLHRTKTEKKVAFAPYFLIGHLLINLF